MKGKGDSGELVIDGTVVGMVTLTGFDGTWCFGEFRANREFEKFATLFGAWSLLIHDDEDRRLSPEAAEELRITEAAIDRLDAHVKDPHSGERTRIRQLNIDSNLIEWRNDGNAR